MQQLNWSIFKWPARSVDITGDGNSFWGYSQDEIHADSPCSALHGKQPLGGKERITDKNHRKDDACGTFYFLHTQVLPSILPGLSSLGGLTKVEQQRVGREA